MTCATKPTTQAAVLARGGALARVAREPRASARESGIWLRSSTTWSEGELVERMLRNEELAWREFLQRFHALIRSVIERTTRRFAPRLGGSEREEIYASFLHGLLQRDMHKLRMFDARRGTQLSTWIGLLATNTAWDHVRAALRKPYSAPTLPAETASPAPDPLGELVAKEAVRELRQLLASLSSKDKLFIELFYVQNLSAEEVAITMNISVKTVYTKKHKLSARLQSVRRPLR